jgi:hypothetical protein
VLFMCPHFCYACAVLVQVYIGFSAGGVWRTDDFFSPQPTWRALTDSAFASVPTTSVGSMALGAADSKMMYLGLGKGVQLYTFEMHALCQESSSCKQIRRLNTALLCHMQCCCILSAVTLTAVLLGFIQVTSMTCVPRLAEWCAPPWTPLLLRAACSPQMSARRCLGKRLLGAASGSSKC